MLVLLFAGCGEGDSGMRSMVYPAGPYALELGATLPDLHFPGVDANGEPAQLSLAQSRQQSQRQLLVLVVSGGGWCGTCLWLRDAPLPLRQQTLEQVTRLDLILGNRDNGPATVGAARAWQLAMDSQAGSDLPAVASRLAEPNAVAAASPEQLGGLLFGRALPLVLVVDRADMVLRDVLSNPSSHKLERRIEERLAKLAGISSHQPEAPFLVDGLFSANEWQLLQRTQLPGAPAGDPSNAVADSPAAAALGRALFFDAELSGSGVLSCASCHLPRLHYYDASGLAQGEAVGNRRAPSLALAAHARWQFWDGRADTLWAQALGPLENPMEMNGSRVSIARRLLTVYRDDYQRTFPTDSLPSSDVWPQQGRPGERVYDQLDNASKRAITRVFVNAAKAIAAWERTLRVAPNPLDAYLAGDGDALNAEQKYGLQLFVRQGCMQCHWGPRLSDDAFHNIGVPASGQSAKNQAQQDQGRYAGLTALSQAEFGAATQWSDDGSEAVFEAQLEAPAERHRGQFKTPPLRGVAHSPFLGHHGGLADFAALMEVYGWGGQPAAPAPAAGQREPWLPSFGETAQWGMVPLLKVLRAEVVGRAAAP